MSESKHITDKLANSLGDAADSVGAQDDRVPGPSPNPATNLLIHDIILRSTGRVVRLTMEKALLGRRYGKDFAREAIDNRSAMQALTAYGITKVATRSIPGFLLVSTGLVAKTLFDRSQGRRKAQRAGETALRDQADPNT
ncbi:MAG: hypothetical protein JY451_02670 [Erythrobacter sp.]|nr:MAG: hypothetical protein JY451_02670 [Erythrobacter sp.]